MGVGSLAKLPEALAASATIGPQSLRTRFSNRFVEFQANWADRKFCIGLGKREEPNKERALASPPTLEAFKKLKSTQSSQPGLSAFAFICLHGCDENSKSSFALLGNIEMLSILKTDSEDASSDESNVSLAPDEIATLTDLMGRYDEVLADIEILNCRLEELLKIEGPKKEEGSDKG